MFSKNKKYIIMGIMFALLIAVGVLNIVLNNNVLDTNTGSMTSAGFFANYRQERVTSRDREIVYLDAIIKSENSSSEIKLNAENKKMVLINNMKMEVAIEGLIKAKGFEDAVVSLMSDCCNVIVKGSNLKSEDVTKIVEIVAQQATLEYDNIKIIPIS